MRPPEEEVIRKFVGEWVRKADQDIASAQNNPGLQGQTYTGCPRTRCRFYLTGKARGERIASTLKWLQG